LAHIPIHNETDYSLTDTMTQYILRDAQEHFGEEIHAIRVQTGLERHAFNARTREVRYAFSPQDFGLGHTLSSAPAPLTPEPPRSRRRSSRRDAEPEADILPAAFEDVEVDAEDTEPLATSLDSLDGERDEVDEDEVDDIFTLDDQNDDEDEVDEEDEEEDEEDDSVFDPDEQGA
jgi:hypothetical protein